MFRFGSHGLFYNSSDSELRFWTAQVTLYASAKMSHGRPDPTLSAFIMINSFYHTSTGTSFHSPHHLPSKVTGTIPGLHPSSLRVSGPWGGPCWPLTTHLWSIFLRHCSHNRATVDQLGVGMGWRSGGWNPDHSFFFPSLSFALLGRQENAPFPSL